MERPIVTVKEIAALEQVSERMVQRYISAEGYKGCTLRAIRIGRSFSISESDYHAWRVLCGFERAPEPQPEPQPRQVEVIAPPVSALPAFPPWPQAADVNGELTLGPHEHSRNFPHPEACRIYMEEQLRKQQIPIDRGYEDEN